MKISASFSKNIFIKDYHKEEFTHSEEKEMNDELTGAEIMLAQVIIANRCEKAVLNKMKYRGYITDELLKERLKNMSKEVKDLEAMITNKGIEINPSVMALK